MRRTAAALAAALLLPLTACANDAASTSHSGAAPAGPTVEGPKVKIMVGGGKANPNLDVQLKPVTLTDAEMISLLDFLESLDCPCDLAAPELPK